MVRHESIPVHLVRWVLVGVVVGVLAGASSAGFLATLDWATGTRGEHGWLLWLLPMAGLASGLAYHYLAGRAGAGNNLILDEIHEPTDWVPRRMAPLVYVAAVGRRWRRWPADRSTLLIAAVSGGFGAVFGVPIAGCVFGLEVHSHGRIRHDAIVPALTASIVGDRVVRWLGVGHTEVPFIGEVSLGPLLLGKLVVAGVAFGLASYVFSELTHRLRALFASAFGWPPLRPFVGGLIVVGLTAAVGSGVYLGLSVPLIVDSLDATVGVATFAFAIKLLFTAVTLGAGFQGGEVTPLFVIGATLGATLGNWLDAPIVVFAAVGFVAVFAGATNTPIACTIMGVEMFGAAAVVPFAIGCVVAYHSSGRSGIYTSQRFEVAASGNPRAHRVTHP